MNVTINYTIRQIEEYTGGRLVSYNAHIPRPNYLSLDSRKILFPESTIFFALDTVHRSGSDFVEALYQKGVRNFLVDGSSVNLANIEDASVIVVKDATDALQSLAARHRSNHKLLPDGTSLPVIGITGSNGKTIVKEWLAHLLENEFSIVRSPGSYNSQVGVPLSVLSMNSSHTLAVFEAGISTVGEMEKLQKIIKPQIGVLTNIGQAHDEGFESTSQKIKEKLLLFMNSEQLVFYGDDARIKNEVIDFKKTLRDKKHHLKLFSWGKKAGNNLQISSINKKRNSTTISAVYKGKTASISIPFIDDASIENAIICWGLLFLLNKHKKRVIAKFGSLYPIAMRLELKQGINNCTIINDSYSNDLHSLNTAINFLTQQKQHARRTVIISDILQSGQNPAELYAEVAAMFQRKNIDRMIGIGPGIFSHQKEFSVINDVHFFLTVEDFIKNISPLHFHSENILVKGARIFGFEQIAITLEQKVHQTVLSINLNAIVHNLRQYKQLLQPSTKIMGMVKAFSYGSGSYEIASVLEYDKIDYLAVAYTDEGVELRKAGINLPIMVMNVETSTFASLVNYNLEPEMFSIGILRQFESYLKSNGLSNYPAHIKIDTGMHRLGFTPGDVKELAKRLSADPVIKVMTVFTHLVASEDEEHDLFTEQQIKVFKKCTRLLEEVLDYPFYKHTANTSAISRKLQQDMDMVRLGIGLYGIDRNKPMQRRLRHVTTLTTTISQIKKVNAGESVGYGRNAVLDKDSTIATVRIGYADGYPRSLGNGRGKMMLSNKLVPVIGNICMDMTMLDVTGLEGIHEGDSVLVFGEELPISTIAIWAKTITYEIMTGISQRVKRVYFEE